MLSRLLLLAAMLLLTLPAAQAQSGQAPARARHYRASELLRAGLTPPAGPAPTPLAALPIPTVRAAAAYAPLPRSASHSLPADTLSPAPRRDLTGIQGAPAYDPYQNWPEAQRKYTLPAVWAEPFLLQLLRGALNR